MARRKPDQQPTGKDAGAGDKRGGYSGAEDAASVPPPERVPSAYLPVARKSR